MNAEQMLKMKTWAVVGATTDPSKYAYKIFKKLKNHGYKVYPVNPNYTDIEGDQVYSALTELPEKPDVVNFVVNPRIGTSIVEQCKELNIQSIWLQPGTVSEELLDLASQNDINAIQACVLVALNWQ